MAAMKKLLEARTASKNRKPTYKRVQSHQFPKLKDVKWRKPKGMGNKVRRNRRGKPSMPQVGFGSPRAVRAMNKYGFKEVVVSNIKDLEAIDSKTQAAVLSKTLGSRKKLDLLAKAKTLKIKIANVKDIDSKIKSLTKEKKVAKKTETKTEAKTEVKEVVKEEAKVTDKKETKATDKKETKPKTAKTEVRK